MKQKILKARESVRQHQTSLKLLALTCCYFGVSFASRSNTSTTNDAAFKNGYNWLDSVIHGYLGILLAGACFVVALIIGIAKQSAMVVVGGVIFALLIAFGPDMVTGIVNSSQVMDSVANLSTGSWMEWQIIALSAICFWIFRNQNKTGSALSANSQWIAA